MGLDRAVDAVDAGKDDVFQRCVVGELPVLLRVATRLTGNPSDAEDLVQETLLRAYRAADRFDCRHPRAWLLTIMRNTWRNMNRRRRPVLLDDETRSAAEPARGADGRGGAEDHVMDGLLDGPLEDALRRLSEDHRAVVVLVDVDGLSYQEAAELLDVPPGTVMSRLHRARARMRKMLEKAGQAADREEAVRGR